MLRSSVAYFFIHIICALGINIPSYRSELKQINSLQLEIEYFPIKVLNQTNYQLCTDECDKNEDCFMTTHEQENCILYSFDFTLPTSRSSKEVNIYVKNGK